MDFTLHRKGRGWKGAEYMGTRRDQETGGLHEV